MRIGQLDIPQPLLEAQRDGKLVVFAGAGVSMAPPSNYPNFEQLAEEIAAGSALIREDNEPLERFLGRLDNHGVKVHRLARNLLTNPSSRPNRLHYDLLRLFDSESGIRLVTTNFDSHFTTAARELFDDGVSIFDAPALPVGDRFKGIVYLHGSVERDPEELVLTDRDFGRAYLTEGWARRFLQVMFARYTVLFVGYSHSDVVMNYLARGLPPETQGKRYALMDDSDDQVRWNLLGVSPIAFPLRDEPNRYGALGESLGRWVDIARMGVLDHEHKIREMTRLPPPLEPEDADYIEGTLRDHVKAKFVARHAEGLEWLRWAEVYQDDLRAPSEGNAKVRVIHASPDAGPVDVVPRGGDPLVTDLVFPEDTPYAEVPGGTYTLDVNAAGTNQTVLTAPDAKLAAGGVYSAFAVGTVYADSLNVLLVQDSASTGATASASASATASASAPSHQLPDTGGSAWLPLTAGLVMACSGVAALAIVRRIISA